MEEQSLPTGTMLKSKTMNWIQILQKAVVEEFTLKVKTSMLLKIKSAITKLHPPEVQYTSKDPQ